MVLALVSTMSILGCKKDDFTEIDTLCPVVIATSPANGETSVQFTKTIAATFNEEMDPSSITAASFFIKSASSSTSIPGEISYFGATASFDPATNLLPNTTYSASITTAAKDPYGNSLQTTYMWNFSTDSMVSPIVLQTTPTGNEQDVVLNKQIAVSFNMPMDPLSINGNTFTLNKGPVQIAGSVSFNDSTATFIPDNDLDPNSNYSARIRTGAVNLDGNSIVNDYAWTFSTGTTTAPIVISVDPLNNESDVSLSRTVNISFSEPMDGATFDSSTFTLLSGTDMIAGTVSYSGITATFTPDANLNSETTYRATITMGAKNLAGVSLSNTYQWDFNTQQHLGAAYVDLQSVERFGIIAGVGVSNDAGFSEIRDMDVGISPGVRSSITGFPPAIIVNGDMFASDDANPSGVAAMLVQAKQDLTDAYLFAESATSPAPATVSGDIGGTTLAPGIYKSTSTLLIQSGDLTLDGQGDNNATWIFQIASDFTTVGGAGGSIILSGGAQAKNITWQTGSSATIGDGTVFKGNILALTSITMNSDAVAQGRMLARNGSVVMTSTNIITR